MDSLKMYCNLRAEIARRGLVYKDIAEAIGTTQKTVSNKMIGARDWNRKEMFIIKDQFFPECTLEYLFTTKVTE